MVLGYLAVIWGCSNVSDAQDPEFFEKKIRPILLERCLSCHGATDFEAGLSMASPTSIKAGGDSGPAIDLQQPDNSILLTAVRYEADIKMPPDGKMSDAEILLLQQWIERGLPWPNADVSVGPAKAKFEPNQAQREWWAYQPLTPTVPPVASKLASGNSIDRFVNDELSARGLHPSKQADKRILLRRAAIDLTGLPPTPEEAAAFLKDDSPRAFANLVDRLLNSPSYGERWGRHWLDAVRYTDYFHSPNSGTFETDSAFRYRDWVVEAFNRDLPYDQFVKMQIAGDLLYANSDEQTKFEGLVATGFLCIGSVDHSDADKEKIVSDLVDDQIDVIGKAFLGITLACARCHDHKFDPISTEDYYGLAGIFYSSRVLASLNAKGAATTIARVSIATSQQTEARAAKESELTTILSQIAASDQQVVRELQEGGLALTSPALSSQAGTVFTIAEDGSISVGGPAAKDVYTVEASIVAETPLKAIRLEVLSDPELPAGGPGRAGDGNFVLSKFEASLVAPGDTSVPVPIAFAEAFADFEQTSFTAANALTGANGSGWAISPRHNENHVAVFNTASSITLAAGSKVTIKLHQAYLDSHAIGKFRLAIMPEDSQIPELTSKTRLELLAIRDRLQAELAVPLPAVHAIQEGGTPSSQFAGIQDVHLHIRGSYSQLGAVVPRRLPEFLAGTQQPTITGSGRQQLAEWIASPNNTLTPRVIVNRIWQHHFGEGLVRTPSNLGKLGELPTHPALLDWLAVQLLQSGWSIKALHREIMLSETYQRSCESTPEQLEIDPDNRFLSRMSSRRYEAEVNVMRFCRRRARSTCLVGGRRFWIYRANAVRCTWQQLVFSARTFRPSSMLPIPSSPSINEIDRPSAPKPCSS